VFTFYETEKEGLTNDHLVYHSAEAPAKAYELWTNEKTGILSTFPFGYVTSHHVETIVYEC
jgi:hypothetical protein